MRRSKKRYRAAVGGNSRERPPNRSLDAALRIEEKYRSSYDCQ